MASLFSPDFQWLWTLLLGFALFWPVRNLIWVLTVRREQRRLDGKVADERLRLLKRRASLTAALLCFVFAVVYVNVLFKGIYPDG